MRPPMNDRDPAQAPSPLAPPMVAQRAPLPAAGLAVACTLHALPLGWAAWKLPFESASWFALTVGLLALLHASVVLLAVLRRERALLRAWLALSLYSLVLLLAVTIVVASAVVYLSGLYQDIGIAVSAALAGVWGLLVLLTVPISAWGLAYTVRFRTPTRSKLMVAGLGLLALLVSIGLGRNVARASRVPGADSRALLQDLGQAAAPASRSRGGASRSLLHDAPARCEQPVASPSLTLLVTAIGTDSAPFTVCLQAPDGAALTADFRRLLEQRHEPGTPLKLDLVLGRQELVRLHPLLDALSLRPALDGICNERSCFAPWQLVPFAAFSRFRPLPAVPDASFGASLDELARMLGSASPTSGPLWRIETASLLVRAGVVTPYLRSRPAVVATDAAAMAHAVSLAGRHIIAAQRPDGSFRYLLDPFSGVAQDRLNLPRQAGTTLALCELLPAAQSARVAARALAQLSSFEQKSGDVSAISDSTLEAELGPTALPLAAFASCRSAVGTAHDALIGRLARLLLKLQRPDGSFSPLLELATGEPTGSYEPLYAGGQAVLALVLVEQLASAAPSSLWPPRAVLHDAAERAMSYYGKHYWPRALRSLFYIEENWHCLAARAALPSHRNDDYERFCLDYVAFKSRLILDSEDGVSPEHAGGYGLSDMFPPHSTASAGFAEALAAALAVKHARGMELATDQALMRRVLSFVLRQQWTDDRCFACARGSEAVGGFSESEASSAIRIDYVQHAMAALGHGSAALRLQRAAQ
ncbi:MAG: hypothetical protein JWN04_6669 [Myxococcaceae bacterium]|nr:hypothetical protein [Myxococcaceae bacterium]